LREKEIIFCTQEEVKLLREIKGNSMNKCVFFKFVICCQGRALLVLLSWAGTVGSVVMGEHCWFCCQGRALLVLLSWAGTVGSRPLFKKT